MQAGFNLVDEWWYSFLTLLRVNSLSLPVQSPGWYRVKLAFRWHISRWNTHSLSYVVPFEEQTGSSYDGQLSTHIHRASLGPNALQTAKKLQETLIHGSRSERQCIRY